MKHWSALRKLVFCFVLVAYAIGFTFAANLTDWRKGMFIVLVLLFLPCLLTFYLMFNTKYENRNDIGTDCLHDSAAKDQSPIIETRR